MKKLFLIPLMTLFSCVMAFATNVSDLPGLQAALAEGGEITLTANITSTKELKITKATTIDGNGFAIKNSNSNATGLIIATEQAVVLKNLIVYCATNSSSARGIQVLGSVVAGNITLDNVTINTMNRGLDIMAGDHDGMQITVLNSTINMVNGLGAPDDITGNPSSEEAYDVEVGRSGNASYSRGINIVGNFKNSSVNVKNTTIRGFYYCVNPCGTKYDFTNSTMTFENSTFKGRAALNSWSNNGTYVFTDCTVYGINIFGGTSEGFASFVLNEGRQGNSLTINGGTVVASVFDEKGANNPNATQYFVADRGSNNTITINNAEYSCTKDLGIQKGGLLENVGSGSTVTVNGGSYDCPEIIERNTGGGKVIINGGDFDVSVVTSASYFPAGYETNFDNVAGNITVNGGTFLLDDESDINALAFVHNDTKEPVSIVSNTTETVANQDGTISVVPAGTKDNTSSATKTEIAWNNASDWSVPTATSNVVIAANQTVTLDGAAGAAYRIDMGDGAKLIVKDGAQLTIGKGGVALYNGGEKKPQIIIEQGAKVITYGLMYNSVAENLIIQASASKHGVLLIDPNAQAYGDNHPMGTVEFVTKSFYKDAEHYQFERFGIPTWNTLESISCDVDGLSTGIYIYENNNWQDLGYLKKGTPFANTARLNKPFVSCNLIAYQEAAGATYRMAGSLMGNSNASLKANLEWNPFANSYTADVDLAAFLAGLASGVNIDPTVYLASPAGLGTYTWDPVDAEWAKEEGTKLAPMQAFILHNHGTDIESSALNYTSMVWNPGISAPAQAPRRVAASDNTAKLRIVVSNEEGVWDNVKMTESATNAHNAAKYMNDDVNIYAMAEEKAGIVAAEDLENTYVGFSTVKGGNFTISFANVEGREFELIDHATGARVAIAEGNTYEFTADANSANDYRFEIVGRRNMPTAIENTEAVKSIKGVYTITGQYVGEMNEWNSLPAGVYVVNGEKRVK